MLKSLGSLVMNWQLFVAFGTFILLNETPLQAARELYYIHAQIQAETKLYSRKRDDSGDVEPQGIVDDEPAGNAGDQQNGHGGVELQNLGNSEPVGGGQHTGQGGIGLQGVGNNNPARDVEIQRTGHWRRFSQGFSAYWMRFWQLFSIPRIRHATVAAFVVMISQQLCGVNVIAFYSASIFGHSGAQGHANTDETRQEQLRALWLSWGFDLTTFVFAWFAYVYIDSKGRRALLLGTVPFLALTLLAAGFSFKISGGTAQIGVKAFFIILFAVFYAPGLGPVPFTYSAEVFPLINREVGMSLAVFWNMFGAGILILTVPFLSGALHATGLLCLFAGLNVIAFIMIFFLVYESKEATLEEMNDIFAVKTKSHSRYQLFHVLPWAFNYYIRRTEKKRLDPPYRWEKVRRRPQPGDATQQTLQGTFTFS
ncbi:MAG: hypothetical protein M1839_004631 [Geoglossum umbratile]|nr:MAG: hypothetical protein M1839_004631 [Geoglossum umbratile]